MTIEAAMNRGVESLGPTLLVPKEHPNQRGPRYHRREEALHAPITAPRPAHRDIPNIVTRGGIDAALSRDGRRHCKHATMSIAGFLWVRRCRCGRQQLYEPTEALAS
jgi:hypothetical protein